MKRLGDIKYLIGILIVILVALILSLEKKKIVDTNWEEEYVLDAKGPKNLYVFLNLLKDVFGQENVHLSKKFSEVPFTDTAKIVYLAINDELRYSRPEVLSLEKLMRGGGQVILIGNSVDFNGEEADVSTYYGGLKQSKFVFNSRDTSLAFKYIHHDKDFKDSADYYIISHSIYPGNTYTDKSDEEDMESVDEDSINTDSISNLLVEETVSPDTSILDSTYTTDNSIQEDSTTINEDEDEDEDLEGDQEYADQVLLNSSIILTIDSLIIWSTTPIDSGQLVIHTAPDFFTNNAALQSFYLDHFNTLVDIIGKDKKIIITLPEAFRLKSESPFEIILKNKYLKTAYYFLLFTMLIYLLFALKRKQKFIPIKQSKTNTTLEYVETLAKLYGLQNQPYKLVGKMEENFYNYVANKFYISRGDEDFNDLLSKKSKIDLETIQDITKTFQSIKRECYCEDQQLIYLYQIIEHFKKLSNDR